MFDPLIDAIKAFVSALFAFLAGLLRGARRMVRFVLTSVTFRSPNPTRPLPFLIKLRRASGALVILALFGWYGTYFWQAAWIRDFSLLYPESIVHASRFSPGYETTAPESGTVDTKSCGRSQIVDMEVYLIQFLVDDNKFVPSMIQHKMGIVGFIPWDETPFFDRKSMFQKGVMKAVRRASIELVDTLGRVRGTSSADPDLEHARGLLQYDEETWWLNPFDRTRPFISTPSDEVFRKAIPAFEAYNDRLSKCGALFDARRDNLGQLLDRLSKDLGSTVDELARRSRSELWNVKTKTFVPAEGNDRGFFDFKADGMFWEAEGEVYAWHGLLQAAHVDMIEAVDNQRLQEIWDQTESHMAEAVLLSPLIVSNGPEDGLIMPAHLAALAQRILRARANVVEMRDVLVR